MSRSSNKMKYIQNRIIFYSIRELNILYVNQITKYLKYKKSKKVSNIYN